MEISQRRRNKSSQGKSTHTVNKSGIKANINFDINTFKALCNLSVSSNKNLRRAHFIQLRNMLETMDMDVFSNEPLKIDYVNFMKKAVETRLQYGNINRDLLIQGSLDAVTPGKFAVEDFCEMSTNDLDYLCQIISNALKKSYLDQYADTMIRIGTAIKTMTYKTQDAITAEFDAFIHDAMSFFRKNTAKNINNTIFDLRSDNFSNAIDDIHDRITAGYRRLYTGMQGFNLLVGDYLEATRVYLLLGTAGVGKSMTLLDIAMQIKKYNKGYVGKDPTKIPTVLYLTQENDVDETIERVFSMVSGGKRMRDFSKEDVKSILIEQGELFLSDDSNINIMVMYKPDKSIDTGDLYTICEELEDDGYELIMVLQDHVKRIHSASFDHRNDLRLELGDVINEVKVFAQMKQLVFMTVGHLNRGASITIENAQLHNTADITKLLGRSNVGESLLMIDNSDCVVLINAEYDKNGAKYLGMNQLKLRYAPQSTRTYLAIPYDPDSPARLLTDAGGIPVFKETLISTPTNNSGTIKSRAQKAIFNDDDLDIEDDDDEIIAHDDIDEFLTQSTITNIPPIEVIHGTSYSMPEEPIVLKTEIFTEPEEDIHEDTENIVVEPIYAYQYI